jgi:predicted 3-demethylubiquinone-9 3-methyltransferase (glyoxalase superfamily)
MQKITPFLWFDDKAEEAVNLYVSILKILRLEALPAMEKKGQRFPEDRRER